MKEVICLICEKKFLAYTQKLCSRKCLGVFNKNNLFGRRKVTTELEKFELLKKSFEKKVIKKEGCWEWVGCKTRTGYVLIRNYDKKISAHRSSWIIHNGLIPEGMCVLHKCDNRICTNPEHLFLGTHKDNMSDREMKGRGQKGITHNKCKLSENDVIEIRKFIDLGLCNTKIANKFGVSGGTIWFIRKGITWKHIK